MGHDDDNPRPTTVLCVGQATLDQVFEVTDRSIRSGHKHVASAHAQIGGGVAANAAVAICRLGGRSQLISRVGADDAGSFIVAELRSYGVDTGRVERRMGVPSSTSAVLVDAAGERTIANHTDARLFDDPPPVLGGDTPDAVLVDGRWPSAALAALDRARAIDVPGIVDVDRAPDGHSRLFEAASHLVFGADALAELAGTDDPDGGLVQVSGQTPAVVAVTLGAHGVRWLEDGTVRSIGAPPVRVVDSTGAGDVFHGALALALAEGRELADAICFASATAAVKCTRRGGRRGSPTRRDVEAFMTTTERDPGGIER